MSDLENMENTKQLEMLIEEINYILFHGYTPPEEWFEERFFKIYTYADLDWAGLAARFEDKNIYLHQSAQRIIHMLAHLIDEWSRGSSFDLGCYREVLHEIEKTWNSYRENYIGLEKDMDVIHLVEGMAHL
jgi:ribulose bisphosphate carboxylase small subunit